MRVLPVGQDIQDGGFAIPRSDEQESVESEQYDAKIYE